MVNKKYYNPSDIFDSKHPDEMTSPNDMGLAISFFKARYNDETGEFQNKILDCHRFDRNAGAVQLFKNGAEYHIPGKETKEYNFKEFKRYTDKDYGKKRSSYGHSERALMRDILDDLIEADGDNPGVLRPSDLSKSTYGVLKELTDNPGPYKEYLQRKKLIVKMWSERPSCEESPENGIGGGCSSFIEEIFPAGSHFGFIVNNYTRADNDPPTKIKTASDEFRKAYISFKRL